MPGSQIVGDRLSQRRLFRVGPETMEELLRVTDDLFGWVNPALPEDLHFLREDGSVVLGSIAQEDDAWLELDAEEMQALRDAHARVAAVLRPH
jgi:hypothetical protein